MVACLNLIKLGIMKSLAFNLLQTKLCKILFIVIVVCLSGESFASHYIGGEIRWECLPNGNYRFHVRVYRECAGIEYSPSIVLNTNIPAANIDPNAVNGITLYLYPNQVLGRTDLSAVCNSNPIYPHITCQSTTQPNTGGVEEWYYTSDQSFPNGVMISGVPPSYGYVFSIDVCNRNDCQNIPSASSLCAYLKATMYPYLGQSVNPCWDNSPLFAERPQVTVPTAYPVTYNPTAFDMDGDSITYGWTQSYDNSSSPIINYYPGYSYTNPLPGPSQDPNNVAAVLDTLSGQLSFTSFTSGAFVTKYMVKEYREGSVIAEIEREMQVVILSSSPNTAPETSLPFPLNVDPYVDSVYFGTNVNFNFTAIDTGLLNNYIDLQNVTLEVNGVMMGTNDTSSCGCPMPPCAHLDVPTPVTGLSTINTNFTWQTQLNHLIFGGLINPCVDYYFVFKASDDFCPIPGITMKPLKIVVMDYVFNAPMTNDYQVDPQNGYVTLNWSPIVNDTTNSFRYYLLYFKSSENAPFQVIDTLFQVEQDNYTHTGINGLTQFFWYMIKTVSGHSHDFVSGPSNIATNFFVGVPDGETDKFSMVYDPALDGIRVSNFPEGCNKLNIEIYNAIGQLVLQKELNSKAGSGEVIRFSAKPGIYLYRVNTGKDIIYGKLRFN